MSTPSSDSQGDVTENGDPPASTPRRWWMWGLVLWLAASSVVVAGIYFLVPPIYEAESMLRIDPPWAGLSPEPSTEVSVSSHLESGMALMASGTVVRQAVAESQDVKLPVLRDSVDPVQTVRDGLRVSKGENTNIVRVAFSSRDPVEAAAIVNAVVGRYLQYVRDADDGGVSHEIRVWKNYAQGLQVRSEQLKAELFTLVDRDRLNGQSAGKSDSAPPKPPKETSVESYQKLSERLLQVDVDLIEGESLPDGGEARTARIETLKKFRSGLQQFIQSLDVTPSKLSPSDEIKAAFLTREIEELSRASREIDQRLVEYRINKEMTRVQLIDAAVAPKSPSSSLRNPLMALAPIALLIIPAVFALFGSRRRRPIGGAQTAVAE
jgi:uncharacterized protein involved in exopolysaccharide biosynthesis